MKFEKKGLEQWIIRYHKTLILAYKDYGTSVPFEIFCFTMYQAPITLVQEDTGPACNKKSISLERALEEGF